jgi:hypothetical protein
MINRNPGKIVPGLAVQQKGFTCSTGDVLSGATINGRILDRLDLGNQRIFGCAEPFITAYTTVGSTSTGMGVATTLSIKLQHGDSSGGGDMADYSTGMQPTDANFLTSQQTTSFQNWSTGPVYFAHQGYYEVTAAKRYVRPVGVWTRGGFTTSTAAGSVDAAYLNMGVRFGSPDVQSFPYSSTSTSTSTST